MPLLLFLLASLFFGALRLLLLLFSLEQLVGLDSSDVLEGTGIACGAIRLRAGRGGCHRRIIYLSSMDGIAERSLFWRFHFVLLRPS